MCGIFVGEEEDKEIIKMVSNRGCNIQKMVYYRQLTLYSSVLTIRGEIEQPVINSDFVFLYNGEIYNGSESDTIFIEETIRKSFDRYLDVNLIGSFALDVYEEINRFENEMALVILVKDFVVFFKDDVGRRSLGLRTDRFQISSVGYQENIDNLYLYIYNINSKETTRIKKKSNLCNFYHKNFYRFADLINQKEEYNFLNSEDQGSGSSIEVEGDITPDHSLTEEKYDDILLEATQKRLVDGNLVVLFSGGVDSNIVTLYLLLVSKESQEIYLINASFGNSQDRINSEVSYLKFRNNFPGRTIHLIHVDLEVEEIRRKKQYLMNLISPKTSKMDFNISVILYYASKEASKYSKVCYLGSGADEVFCGYNKYKESSRFRDDMLFDLFTISYHNTTRDDRCISDNNIEPRFIFLDTQVIEASFHIANEEIKNKEILRQLLCKYNLGDLAGFKKKAMQYGSGMYKIERHIFN